MRLRDVYFNPVACASGARNFDGKGYPFHKNWKWRCAGLTFENTTFVAKTTTLEPRLEPEKKLGNMLMQADGITPQEERPACIVVNPWRGVTLNAVGLSGPGALTLLRRGYWHLFNEGAFFISFMAVGQTMEQRLQEWHDFVMLLAPEHHRFKQPVGLEMNFSCPNVGLGHDQAEFVTEVCSALNIAAPLRIPLQAKFNGLVQVESWLKIAKHPACDAFVIGNTLPWGTLSERIDWHRLFGSPDSPLKDLGGGGLSGPPLVPIHCALIREATKYGLRKPVWGCGGIFKSRHIAAYRAAGQYAPTKSIVKGVQLGTVAIHRPWRMPGLIRYAHEVFSSQ